MNFHEVFGRADRQETITYTLEVLYLYACIVKTRRYGDVNGNLGYNFLIVMINNCVSKSDQYVHKEA